MYNLTQYIIVGGYLHNNMCVAWKIILKTHKIAYNVNQLGKNFCILCLQSKKQHTPNTSAIRKLTTRGCNDDTTTVIIQVGIWFVVSTTATRQQEQQIEYLLKLCMDTISYDYFVLLNFYIFRLTVYFIWHGVRCLRM